jgi:glycolate oxidase iron-sulfur subunit
VSPSGSLARLAGFINQAEKCLKCGLCLYQCPVYREKNDESLVARGRNSLILKMLNGEVDFTQEFKDNLSSCLLCNRCSMFCPAGIRSDQLVLSLRASVVKTQGLSLPKKIAYRQIIPFQRRFSRLLKLAHRFQKALPCYEGDLKRLPSFLSPFKDDRYIPNIDPVSLLEKLPEVVLQMPGTGIKKRVGFFVGCVFNLIWPEIGKSIIHFLSRNRMEVVIPQEQGCCGMPVLGAGDLETARVLADNAVNAFRNVDIVISGCATCSSALKHYPVYLADTEERARLYGEFSAKIKDLTEFIVDSKVLASAQVTYQGKKLRVTYHDPCHMARYQQLTKQPREILKSLDGVELVEMDGADDCCGMGGAFSISHHQLSQKIADNKIRSIIKTGADIVVTTCPGCMMQIQDGLLRHKMPQRVLHLAQLLNENPSPMSP